MPEPQPDCCGLQAWCVKPRTTMERHSVAAVFAEQHSIPSKRGTQLSHQPAAFSNSKQGTQAKMDKTGPTCDRFLHCAGDADCAMASSRCHSRLQQVQRGAFRLGRCRGRAPSKDDCLQSQCQLISWGSSVDR